MMTIDKVIDMLDTRRGVRTWSELAEEIGITRQALSGFVNGRHGPGPKVLRFLGLRESRLVQKVYEMDGGRHARK